MSEIKRIGVMTAGGDCPGLNAGNPRGNQEPRSRSTVLRSWGSNMAAAAFIWAAMNSLTWTCTMFPASSPRAAPCFTAQ